MTTTRRTPHDIALLDYNVKIKQAIRSRIGHYFLFVDDPDLAVEGKDRRRERLLVDMASEDASRRVIPLLEEPVELHGLKITPKKRDIDPLACIVCDRDLYRAEQDTVYLYVACPHSPKNLRLVVAQNGSSFIERDVELDEGTGVGIETLSMLLPGTYKAQLAVGDRRLGAGVTFTVAEYSLAPLSARLVSHQLDRQHDELRFDLAVESYQVPFTGKLDVALVEDGREVARTTVRTTSAGRYQGSHSLKGDGPFRLRLTATDQAERLAEVAIPGSRAAERETTLLNELGTEVLFSMMPEPEALPIRGGYLTEGDHLDTPFTVESVVTTRRAIRVNADVQSLKLVVLDLVSGEFTVEDHGNPTAGEQIIVKTASPLATVFAGCFVGDRPFEAYTSFFEPSHVELSVQAPRQVRPAEDVTIRLSCARKDSPTKATIPVLLCVRDERLTATDTPAVSLGAATKRGIDSATAGMADGGILRIEEHYPFLVYPRGERTPYPPPPLEHLPRDIAMNRVVETTAMARSASIFAMSSPSESPRARKALARDSRRITVDRAILAQTKRSDSPTPEPPRSEFPEVLFYGLVPVRGTEEVIIPAGDSLGTFRVEAFALDRGDWVETTAEFAVDQPVRLDLELPPAVHDGDKVKGRLRVATTSGQAKLALTRDGDRVPLYRAGETVSLDAPVQTPVELELDVAAGTYHAVAEDPVTGEKDSLEVDVGTPGRFKSYARELHLVEKGQSLTLDSEDALSLRVFPAIEQPFDSLVTATAGYSHLCCEQTAAKILSAVFLYLTSERRGRRRKAEQIILAGVAREKEMLLPGKGFAMYPGRDQVSDHYSRLAVRYLWSLASLDEIDGLSSNLRRAVREGLELADTAATAHQMERVPKEIRTLAEAHAAATSSNGTAGRAKEFIESAIDFGGSEPRLRNSTHAVAERAALAYAGASLIALGDLKRGVTLANRVTRQLNENGNLYSTVDSVAAVALMIQIRRSGLLSGDGRVRANGQAMTTAEAAAMGDSLETIDVLEGMAAIEVLRLREEDWNVFASAFPVRVGFRDQRDKKVKSFRAGDRADLLVSLPDGYRNGDLLHVSLPACLSWIRGGGKVKRFTLDFEGSAELRVPVVVTSDLDGKQRFAVCVRNMFEEERAASPGLVEVKAPGWLR